jgi:predicted nucleotidyltransferase
VDESKLKKIVAELKDLSFTKAVILFGSSVKGKATPISDIDVCVIDDEKFSKTERRKVYGYSTDKIQVSLFSDLPLYIKYEVLRGKILVVRDEKYFKKLKGRTVLNYLHTKWLWEEHFELRKRLGKWSIGVR